MTMIRVAAFGLILSIPYCLVQAALHGSFALSAFAAAAVTFLALGPLHFLAHRVRSPLQPAPWGAVAPWAYAASLMAAFVVDLGLVWLHSVVSLADPIESQVLSIPIALLLGTLVLRGLAARRWEGGARRPEGRWSGRAAILLVVLGGVTAYLAASTVVLFTNDVIYWDEWRLYDDYLADKPFLTTLFERHERVDHVTPVPHVFFMANLFLLDGRGVWLALCILAANLLLVGAFSAVYALGARRLRLDRSFVALACVVLALITFWLQAYRSLYWGICLMYYLAAIGVVAACAGLSFALPRSARAAPVAYLCGAVLASASFSAGAASWFLAPVAAVSKRFSVKTVLAATAVAVAGSLVSVGHFAFGDRGLLEFAEGAPSLVEVLLSWLLFVLLLVGKPVAVSIFGGGLFEGPFTEQGGLMVTALVGALGVAGWIAALVVSYGAFGGAGTWSGLPRPQLRAIRREWLFFSLLSTFGFGGALLVAIGRAPAGLHIALQTRFTHLAVLFWIGQAGCLFLATAAVLAGRRSKGRSWAYVAIAAALGAVVTVGNLRVAEEVVPRLVNNRNRRELMLLVDAEGFGRRMRLWRPDKTEVVLGVAEEIRRREKNVFATPWKASVGERVDDLGHTRVDFRCAGGFFPLGAAGTPGNTLRLHGWALPVDARDEAVRGLVFVREGRIEGLGLPFFGRVRPDDDISRHLGAFDDFAQTLPYALARVPGISNLFGGLVRTTGDGAQPGALPFDLVLGVLDEERMCVVDWGGRRSSD